VTTDALADVVRRNLALSDGHPVSLTEVGEFSNINYVYRVSVPGRRTFYLKVVPPQPKNFPVPLPGARFRSEAESIRRFRAHAGRSVVIPEVLFVDREAPAIGMSDVGEARSILFSVLDSDYDLLAEQARNLGSGLGAVHAGTAHERSPRPAEEEKAIRHVIFHGLLAPGVKQLMPELWHSLSTEMQEHRDCLVHGDLWSKNLLVRKGEPVAIVDFEGVTAGDPAFDLGTLITVALIPAMQQPQLIGPAMDFAETLLASWSRAVRFTFSRIDVEPRTYRAIAVFLAARAFGPFAYEMGEDARGRIANLACSLAGEPVTHWNEFAERVIRFGVARSA
jgi:tRNA A-37 threonylcarbamoyl transferase component Bud32